nr:immunoglobulin light chain junction region [Macaca mulatta]
DYYCAMWHISASFIF